MNISVLPVSFFQDLISGAMTLEQCTAMVSQCGAQGIDLSPVILNGMMPEKVREVVELTGLQIGMLVSYSDFSHPDKNRRKEEVHQAITLARRAKAMGAGSLRLTAGQKHPDTGREQGINWVAEGIENVADALSDLDIDLVFENHSRPVVWEYDDFAYPGEIFLEIAQRIVDTPVGVLFDTANPLSRNEDPLMILEQVIAQVRYVHASDIKAPGRLEHVVVGTGAVPLRSIFRKLKGFGYDGWVAVEENSKTGAYGMEQAVNNVKQIWNEALIGGTI